MSNEMLNRCAPLRMPPSAKVVLLCLADHARPDRISLAVSTIVAWTCLSERTVQSAIAWLEQKGLITVHREVRRSNFYLLHPERYAAESDQADDVPEMHRAAPVKTAAAAPSATIAPPAAVAPLTPQQLPHRPRSSCTLSLIHPVIPNTPLPPLSPHSPPSPAQLSVARSATGRPTRQPRDNDRAMSLATWLAECKATGVQPLPEDDPVFDYSERVGINRETLYLQWVEFKRLHIASGKHKPDWREAFRTTVRRNSYRLWAMLPSGECRLTSQGQQALALLRSEQEREAA